MVCLGLEPGVAGWKAQTNPLSYGGTPKKMKARLFNLFCYFCKNDQDFCPMGKT